MPTLTWQIPISLRALPALLKTRPVDVALLSASPPDRFGNMSLGCSVDVALAALQSARTVVVQVNRHMPRTFGDAVFHESRVQVAVEGDAPLPVTASRVMTTATARIGERVADLVHNGSTLQIGIGEVPDAVLHALQQQGKRDLGVHTEMFSNGLLPLIRDGTVSNAHKTLDRGSVTSSFCVGDAELWRFLHEQPHLVRMRDSASGTGSCVRNAAALS
jgi:4-hydroxybutyrate CoA-transferase